VWGCSRILILHFLLVTGVTGLKENLRSLTIIWPGSGAAARVLFVLARCVSGSGSFRCSWPGKILVGSLISGRSRSPGLLFFPAPNLIDGATERWIAKVVMGKQGFPGSGMSWNSRGGGHRRGGRALGRAYGAIHVLPDASYLTSGSSVETATGLGRSRFRARGVHWSKRWRMPATAFCR